MRWPWKRAADGEYPAEPAAAEPVSSRESAPGEPPEAAEAIDSEQTECTPAGEAEHSLIESLTPRERDVFDLLIQGLKLQEVADELGIKFSTVNTHQKSVYRKLGVNSRAECILRYGKPGKEW